MDSRCPDCGRRQGPAHDAYTQCPRNAGNGVRPDTPAAARDVSEGATGDRVAAARAHLAADTTLDPLTVGRLPVAVADAALTAERDPSPQNVRRLMRVLHRAPRPAPQSGVTVSDWGVEFTTNVSYTDRRGRQQMCIVRVDNGDTVTIGTGDTEPQYTQWGDGRWEVQPWQGQRREHPGPVPQFVADAARTARDRAVKNAEFQVARMVPFAQMNLQYALDQRDPDAVREYVTLAVNQLREVA